jgi:excisionase family DNA binding protein
VVAVTVTVLVNGSPLPVEIELGDEALANIADAVAAKHAPEPQPEFLTVEEAALLLRCKRQRVYDLLSARRLQRVKDGSRTLLRRADVLAYVENSTARNPR